MSVKRLIVLIGILSLVSSLVACGDNKKTSKDEKMSTTESVLESEETREIITELEETTSNKTTETVVDDTKTSEEVTTEKKTEVEITTKKQQSNKKYTFKKVSDGVHFYSTKKDNVKVYDQPASSGKVVDTFGYKHLMYVESICKETGWYKIIYDDDICGEKNYQDHWRVVYSGENEKNRIILTKEAKELKTAYINPKDVANPASFEDEVFHKWNDLEMPDYYGWTTQSMNFYKNLCYAKRFTVVEHEGDENITYNMLGMFVPSEKDDDKGLELIKKYLDKKGAIMTDYGISGIGTRPAVRFIRVEYLEASEQRALFWGSTYSTATEFNWTYFEETYGYSKEAAIERCEEYMDSVFWDGAIGTLDDEDVTSFTMKELVEVCKIADQYTLEVLKRPSINRYKLYDFDIEWPEEEGEAILMYYMYTPGGDAEKIAKCESMLTSYKESWTDKTYEEVDEFVTKTEEGVDVYIKKCYFTKIK